jgi:hypothetical protein
MSGLLQWRKSVGVMGAIIVSLFAVREARAGSAYLASVGSPPLRFQALTTNRFVFALKTLAAAKPAEAPATASPLAAPAVSATNVVALSNPIFIPLENTNPVSVRPQAETDGKNDYDLPVISPNPSPAASDLLTVTPQMIAEYLKPAQNQAVPINQTNQTGATMFVPAEMQFAPPTSKAPGESQATYKTQ